LIILYIGCKLEHPVFILRYAVIQARREAFVCTGLSSLQNYVIPYPTRGIRAIRHAWPTQHVGSVWLPSVRHFDIDPLFVFTNAGVGEMVLYSRCDG
jgi:hypothetical protein